MYVLGINETHTAAAALLKDGEVIACAQEERFTRVKAQSGYPKQAIDYCLNYAAITINDIDLLVFGGSNPILRFFYSREDLQKATSVLNDLLLILFDLFPAPFIFGEKIFRLIYKLGARVWKEIHVTGLSRISGVPRKKICYFDHHLAHAASAYFVFGKKNKPKIVVTNDSSGDGFSGKVFVVRGNKWRQIASSSNRLSLASIYYYLTKLLGFKGDEEEYKVMGLSGYVDKKKASQLLPIFEKLVSLEGISFKGQMPYWLCFSYLKRELFGKRFDFTAGSLQQFVENLMVKQIKNAIKKTGIKEVILGGGLAMNVKANMKVARTKELTNLSVCPSSGDEANAIGYCFLGFKKLCDKKKVEFVSKPLSNLYLGPEFNGKEIMSTIKKYGKEFNFHKLGLNKNKHIAKLLVEGKIIARFAGRMEFGARALGNRSILADPRNIKVIKIINEQIKGRDFWMPFAPTILYDRAKDYLINPKNIDSPFMMIGFETTKKAQEEIPAALHPADFTCRPQILKREDNPQYYDLIKEFEKITGVGAILNTSFNLHGEPIVCGSKDTILTFKKSKLEYLLLGDYLISKSLN